MGIRHLVPLAFLAAVATTSAQSRPPVDAVLERPGIAAVQTTAVNAQVQVVFVQGKGEELTQDEITGKLEDIRTAITWWRELSPITTTLSLSETVVITTSYDALDNWRALPVPLVPDVLTIYVVDNSAEGHGFLLNGDYPEGLSYLRQGQFYGPLFVVTARDAAIDTHEMGHAVYGLPDLYFDDKPAIDIMDTWLWEAYMRRFIGWETLDNMGRKPFKVYFPIAGR